MSDAVEMPTVVRASGQALACMCISQLHTFTSPHGCMLCNSMLPVFCPGGRGAVFSRSGDQPNELINLHRHSMMQRRHLNVASEPILIVAAAANITQECMQPHADGQTSKQRATHLS